jgi:hypothetical protein
MSFIDEQDPVERYVGFGMWDPSIKIHLSEKSGVSCSTLTERDRAEANLPRKRNPSTCPLTPARNDCENT